MRKEYSDAIAALQTAGWAIKTTLCGPSLPPDVSGRYAWLRQDERDLISELEYAVSPTNKTWLLGASDFARTSESAFRWNEWELMSLSASDGHLVEIDMVRVFWDAHFPICNSVKDCYAYFSIPRVDRKIVVGEEPEFEDSAREIVPDLVTFLAALAQPNAEIRRWV